MRGVLRYGLGWGLLWAANWGMDNMYPGYRDVFMLVMKFCRFRRGWVMPGSCSAALAGRHRAASF